MDDTIIYTIRLKGHLDTKWAEWFDGMKIIHEPNGETLLHGNVADQAALHGLLTKARDLGLPLLGVTRSDQPSAPAQSTEEPQ